MAKNHAVNLSRRQKHSKLCSYIYIQVWSEIHTSAAEIYHRVHFTVNINILYLHTYEYSIWNYTKSTYFMLLVDLLMYISKLSTHCINPVLYFCR